MTGMQLIREHKGMMTQIARAIGLTPSAVMMWRRVPAEHLPAVEAASGIPRWLLRPDICQPPVCRRSVEQ